MTSQAGEHVPMKDPHDAELDFELAKPARWSAGRVLVIVLVTAAIFAGLFAFAYFPRRAARETLVKEAAERAQGVARVTFVKPRLVSSARTLTLPGSVQPLEEAVIYARASGYVRRWLVDIGSRVKQGDLLAEIDTPEIDQELAQARAALAQSHANVLQAKANQGLNVTRLDRTGKLVEAGLSPAQDLDQTQAQSEVGAADVKVAQANVAAQEANIRRLNDLKGFSRVLAPFAGTITERSVDRGSLVAAGNASASLFKLASTDTVRVYVQVPQDAAPSVALDESAELHVREFPNEKFLGKVARTAGALDSGTRTLSTEVRVPNPDGRLLAGMYAEVALSLPSARRVFELPATSLLNDAGGLRIAVVGPGDKVRLQRIVLERDLGATVQIASGVEGDERVIQVAGVEFEDGQQVEAVAAPAPAASATVSTPAPVVVPPSVIGSSPVAPPAPSAVPAPR